MEPEGSFHSLHEPITGPFPEPDESNQHLSTLFLLRSILILASDLRLGLTTKMYTFLIYPYPLLIIATYHDY
jgi:hypothetical protein